MKNLLSFIVGFLTGALPIHYVVVFAMSIVITAMILSFLDFLQERRYYQKLLDEIRADRRQLELEIFKK